MANIGVNKGWERLSQIIEESGMTIHSFAMAIGLSRSETLYQIKRGQIGISHHIAELVTSHYPEYSKAWLQTGYGSKYADPISVKGHVPFYNCDLSRLPDIEHITPESYIYMPMLGSVDFAITYHGEDMSPSVPSGTILILSQIDANAIVFGNDYVVSTAHITTLRRIRATEDSIQYRLEADDPSRFDDLFIRRSDISAIYAVKARIILKN
ncbi:MAG: hypothetical protein II986_08245 [Alistipes sp.]|nr:hypothetical protein [Alistipes sp.]